MSAVTQPISSLLSFTVKNTVFNPVITASLLYILTRGPESLRRRLIGQFAYLQDPGRLATIINVLKGLVSFAVINRVNGQFNKMALNAWRVKSEKKRWNLAKEIAVITGGCSGIGALTVKGLAERGVRVAVLDIQGLPESLRDNANVKFFECDITNPDSVTASAERIRATWGSPSILINNAGVAQAHTILDTSHEWLRKIFDVNLLSNFTTIKAFLPDMIAQNKGHIVSVASLASFITVAGMVDYCATKAGLLSLHEGLNQELRHRYNAPNVLTTSIHPNWVRTPLIQSWESSLKALRTDLLDPQTVADSIVAQIVKCEGAQICLPDRAGKIGLLRGFPNWLQEVARDGTKNATNMKH
ncbi:dehydrogenase/reductase SDR family member 8 precursor [Amniculicola lignicola CBS 123094]|uniref:Short-chain dehydrogenase/reductase 3 n=1 Tax=Amniculicola lignicola CBS 123094 TaxID=1392246 RepID=A0A6A5WZR7_9PLEO|nr:dehydrogenase/reductase SDR family member 8 precursor [Amniculicola lignicola CBS 123094]